RLEAEEGAGLVRQALQHPRFRSTEASRLMMRDMSLVTQARAMLLADPVTSRRSISVDCTDGVVSLGGRVEEWSVRRAAEQALGNLPGIREIRFLSPAAIEGPPGSVEEGRPDLHGEAHRWGGHGPSRREGEIPDQDEVPRGSRGNTPIRPTAPPSGPLLS